VAAKLGVTPNYYTSFVDGQGTSASSYVTYAEDLDTNFVAIKTAVNSIIDEVQAVNGTAALISQDLATLTSASGPFGVVAQGVLGSHSYLVARDSATQLSVSPGSAIVNAGRVVSNSTVTFSSITGDGDKFVALDSGGVPFLETAAGQQALDVAKITMTGGSLDLATLEQLALVLPDGDGNLVALSRSDDSSVWATGGAGGPLQQNVLRSGFKIFRNLGPRFRAIERMLIGYSTEDDGASLPAHGIAAGSAATPALIATSGTGTRDTTTGWFRQAANIWGFAASATERLRLGSFGVQLQNGSAAAPALSFIQSTTIGLFRAGANRLGIATAGVQAAEWDAVGNLDLTLQTRGVASNASLSLSDGTAFTNLSLDTEGEDIGGSFAATSTAITVPTDADGRWNMLVEVVFDESTIGGVGPNTGQRGVAIQWNGTTVARVEVDAITSGDTALTTAYEGNLSAAQVIRAQAYQNNDDNSACTINVRVSWRKVA
jgi:hypothetical protein